MGFFIRDKAVLFSPRISFLGEVLSSQIEEAKGKKLVYLFRSTRPGHADLTGFRSRKLLSWALALESGYPL